MNKHSRTIRRNRIRSRISGTAQRPRASVFRSLSRVTVQLIDDTKNQTLLAVNGDVKKGQDKMAQAEKVGNEVASQAQAKGITTIVFDRGGYRYHGRVKAVADAMRAGGLKF